MQLHKKLIVTSISAILSTGIFAASISQKIDMNNSWYKSVKMKNVTANYLGYKVGDKVTITSPFETNVTSTWGSITLSGCHTKYEKTESINTCELESIGSWSNDLSFGLNVHNQQGTTSNGFVTIGEQSQTFNGTVTINLPPKPAYISDTKLAHIIIYRDNVKISDIDNKPWNQPISIPVEFTDGQTFTISVPDLERGVGSAVPASFTLKNNSNQDVNISYVAPQAEKKGNLSVLVSIQGNNPTIKPHYTLKNDTGVSIKDGDFNTGINNINNLTSSQSGLNYRLNTPSFIDGNTQYSVESGVSHTVDIKTNKTTNISLMYTGEVIQQENLNMTVSDFPAQGGESTITLINQNNNNTHTLKINRNGTFSISIPQDNNTWSVSASSINSYMATVIPNTFTANKDSNNLQISYKKIDPSVKLMPYKDVTYNMDWSTTPAHSNLREIADNSHNYSYTLAFITQNAWSQSCFPAWGGSPSLALQDKLYLNDVNYLKSKGGSIGVSFGGENGATLASKCSQSELTQAYEKTLNTYEPLFIDFDIEGGALGDTSANTNRINALKTLQEYNPNLKVTFTLPANIDGFPALALNIIKEAKEKGVKIFEYNMMSMAWYSQKLPGPISDSVIATAKKGLEQLKAIFTNKTDQQLWSMIRVTPKIGVDYDASIFYPSDAKKVGDFVKQNGLAGVAFWSADIDRNQNKTDNCLQGASPDCSGITQAPYDFTKAFLSSLM